LHFLAGGRWNERLAPLLQLLFFLLVADWKAGAASFLHFLAGGQWNERLAPLLQLLFVFFGWRPIEKLVELLFCMFWLAADWTNDWPRSFFFAFFGWPPIERMMGTSCTAFFAFFAVDRLFNQSAPVALLPFVLFCCPPIIWLVCTVYCVCFFTQSSRGRLVRRRSRETFFNSWWRRVHQERRRRDRRQATEFALFLAFFCKLAGVDVKFATTFCLTTISPGLFLIVGGEESTKSIVVKTNRKRRSLRCFLCFFIWLEWTLSSRHWLVWQWSCETFLDFWWRRVHQEHCCQSNRVCTVCCICFLFGWSGRKVRDDVWFDDDLTRLFLVLVEKSPPRASSLRPTASDRVCTVSCIFLFG